MFHPYLIMLLCHPQHHHLHPIQYHRTILGNKYRHVAKGESGDPPLWYFPTLHLVPPPRVRGERKPVVIRNVALTWVTVQPKQA